MKGDCMPDPVAAENDYGFSLTDDETFVDKSKKLAENYLEQFNKTDIKLKSVLDIINPFLDKLQESPEKTALKWPNRAKRVKEIQNKIREIVNT